MRLAKTPATGPMRLAIGTEEVLEGPLLGLCASTQVAPHSTRVGEVKSLEERVEVEVVRRRHERTPAKRRGRRPAMGVASETGATSGATS